MAALHQLGGVADEVLEPGQLVVELRSRLGIAIGQVQAGHQQAVDGRFEVAAVGIAGVARQAAAYLQRLAVAGEDGDAVPRRLALPDRAVSGLLQRRGGKRASGVFSSCRQTMSGASRSSQASSAASRVWMPLTLKVAIFRVSTGRLRE